MLKSSSDITKTDINVEGKVSPLAVQWGYIMLTAIKTSIGFAN